jgi:hypothetical protein
MFKIKCINSSKNAIFTYMYSVNSNIPTFQLGGLVETGILKIVDSLGKTIFQQDIKKNQKEIFIDANKYSEGYYVLQISSSNYIGNQKFIK